ncbi:NAD-dependent epimerase/dehydratase family protein [Opitutales bacterium ASA1]|uniref:NAD-dependent epimerase/dehydratase family protein n=1 Tax=Congregicoccus parvus TaxID=3081749 RepID=UPI002B299F15|nr:NAD-dependent epimerase/dehydratase family protein [Opitutales bacterium ASA1]
MHLLITGICGFVGSTIARTLLEARPGLAITGIDNLVRPGSHANIAALKNLGVRLVHGDIRCPSDFETLPAADWVIDSAANASVLAGVDGATSSRQLVEHNLVGTVNLLEYCKSHRAGFVLLSTSRVYSIPPLASLAVVAREGAFTPDASAALPPGLTAAGVDETFSTAAPVSLYGATKLASEALALEYGAAFDFPALVNRCGVMAGAGQFGRPDQGIFAYWIHSWARRRPLKYIGFEGTGHQTRDCLHPVDVAALVLKQIEAASLPSARVLNVSGGVSSARSLRQLSEWCAARFGPHTVAADLLPRPFDIPWMVLDADRARSIWKWAPTRSAESILEEIAAHAEAHPAWLELSAPY